MACVEAAVLIAGGFHSHASDSKAVEVYAPGLHLRLPDLPVDRSGSTVNLVDGMVLLCGSYKSDLSPSKACYQMQRDGQ